VLATIPLCEAAQKVEQGEADAPNVVRITLRSFCDEWMRYEVIKDDVVAPRSPEMAKA
jgi:hypothetical protein